MPRTLLILLLAGSLAAAQSAEAPKKIQVEGKVVSVTGDPLSKATLRLVATTGSGNAQTTSTDSEGKFAFEDVPVGRYTLSAARSGFITQSYGARSLTGSDLSRPDPTRPDVEARGVVFNLKAGTSLKDLVFKLTPQAVASGRVTDEDGEPVAGIQVLAMQYEYAHGRQRLVTSGFARTNDEGDYRIADLIPGRYYLQASDPSLISATTNAGRPKPQREANVPTYYPSSAHPSDASALDIAPGSEKNGFDIRLRRVRVYSVRGRAVASDGGSMAGYRLVLAPKGSNQASFTTVRNYSVAQVQPDGTFEFQNLQPDTFEVVSIGGAAVNGQRPPSYMSRAEVTINASDIEGFEPSFVPMGPIDGVVLMDEGGVSAQRPPRLQVELSQVDGTPVSIGSGRPNADGKFQFTGGGAVRFWWSVNGLSEGIYVKSARFDGRDVTRTPIDNTSGAGGTLQIVLSTKAASLIGTARNDKGEGVVGASLRVWPKIPDLGTVTSGVLSTTSDQDGGFRFAGLAPGEYYVAAWEEIESGLAQSAEFLARFNGEASLVKLGESAQWSADVKLIPPEKMAAEITKLQ